MPPKLGKIRMLFSRAERRRRTFLLGNWGRCPQRHYKHNKANRGSRRCARTTWPDYAFRSAPRIRHVAGVQVLHPKKIKKSLSGVSLVSYTIRMKQYEIEVYFSEDGKEPFTKWLSSIKDEKAKTLIIARVSRASLGNFGDWKAIQGTKNLYEMRIHYGQGLRIYYTTIEQKIVLLLAGSTKRTQDKAIVKAQEYLVDYNERIKP